jgi:hypothetical protein
MAMTIAQIGPQAMEKSGTAASTRISSKRRDAEFAEESAEFGEFGVVEDEGHPFPMKPHPS